MSTKQSQLQAVEQEIVTTQVCSDLAAQATQLVFGVGNPDAAIVFVGEAPGKNEDEQGEPFVGAAGKLLNEMLSLIGLRRQDVYITNIVKYRPLKNRDPLASEKLAFLPFLKKQLNIIKPKLIVTLGRHSMDSLLPGLRISEVHGQLQNHDGQAYMPLYHPAAALYNGGLRQTLFEDFARIPSILETI